MHNAPPEAAPFKPRFPHHVADYVAREILAELAPACTRAVIAGSLRRLKRSVGDIELLYIPRIETRPIPGELFGTQEISLAEEAIQRLERRGTLERRRNVNGSETYGPKNKLMRHVASGIPVDLFTATHENWFNYLVCRTGPGESNIRICNAAIARGWKWNPYGPGFTRDDGTILAAGSESAVFEAVGLPCVEPWNRK